MVENWFTCLGRSRPVETIFDVGANRGQTVVQLRAAFPTSRIFAFEPGQEAFAALRRASGDDVNTLCRQVALGATNEIRPFYENASNATSSLLQNAPGITDHAPREMVLPQATSHVEVMRIDTFCSANDINCIDIMKIDTQGFEKHVLLGAGDMLSPDRIRGLMVELLFVDLYEGQSWAGEILEMLRSRGYRLYGFTDVHRHQEHGWKWANGLFNAS